MCRWVSTKPGITIDFEASITCALGALMSGFTAEILLPSIRTSAFSKSPTDLSSDSTQPPLSRIGRPAAGFGAACASPVPITLAIAGAATVAAAVVHRNCRRDRPLRGAQHGHAEVNACDMTSSQGVIVAAMLILPHISIQQRADNVTC